MSGFFQALPFTLEMEGGFTVDTGGPTMKGVTEAVYHKWLTDQGMPKKPVKQIDEDELNTIYYKNYWVAAKCDKLPWPLSMIHFDCAVNTGVKRAIEILQDAVGADSDGDWGPETQNKLGLALANDVILFNDMLWTRADFYYSLAQNPKYKPYLIGWLRRVLKLRRKARELW